MKKYYCPTCKVEVDTSECPNCNQRTISLRKVYWCDECNSPIIDSESCEHCGGELRAIGTDIRPVFPEERLLIEVILGTPMKYVNSSVWCIKGGLYFIDGERVSIRIKDLKQLDDKAIRNEYIKYSAENSSVGFDKYLDCFIQLNNRHYESITSEALDYIRDVSNSYDVNSLYCSFSGGKDSTVTSDLVIKALGTPKIVHVFGDTTLEFPYTEEYVKRFKKNNRYTPMFTAKNKEKDFYELCETIGPPSRVMRWCCTVFKTGAITKTISTLFKNKTRILTFYGIRRSESTSRSKYDRDSESPKITKQRTVSPIIDWYDADVWLYLVTAKVDFNDAYRLGFSRVGCWCCPNNSFWSEFLSKIHMEEQYKDWRDLLIRNAIKIGKPDPEVYVDEGWWKSKQGGEGIEYSTKTHVSFKECATEENAFNYELQNVISSDLYEYFKPLGKLDFNLGNPRLGEVYVLDRNSNPLLKLQGRVGQNILKVSIINNKIANSKNLKEAESKVRCQLTKYQTCLNCSGCVSVCKFNAINIKEIDGEIVYRVDENKCLHCYECVDHFPRGCYMTKVLATKQGG